MYNKISLSRIVSTSTTYIQIPSIMHRVIYKYANTMRANILYVASTWQKERSRQKKTRVRRRRRRRVVTGRAGEKKERKKREERAKLGRLCLSGRHRIARRIKNLSKKYSHCKSSHLQSTPSPPSASYFSATRRWNGTPKRGEDITQWKPAALRGQCVAKVYLQSREAA